MASFKTLTTDDIASTTTVLHESIPITGTILSGTYADANIKPFTHGLFKTVFDYPYASSSANPLFDMTVGHNVSSPASASAVATSNVIQLRKKINIYNQMAKVLAGADSTGSIINLDEDGRFDNAGTLLNSCFFLNFSRLLVKDEIKKGSFSLTLGINTSSTAPFNATVNINDAHAANSYFTNSPVGEYAILTASSLSSGSFANANTSCGLIFYQAGVVVLNSNIFAVSSSNDVTASLSSNQRGLYTSAFGTPKLYNVTGTVDDLFASGSMNDAADALRKRIANISINNSTELNSTIYFCKIGNREFNYSANPTYLSGSAIRVKNQNNDAPIAYFTTVGLYSDDGALLAVAKVSEPIKKDPTTELTLRVRLDY